MLQPMNPLVPYRYPEDGTGLNSDNAVVGEVHTLKTGNIRCVAPIYGGFFCESIVVYNHDTGIQLIEGVDYYFAELYEFPSHRYGKEICGLVVVKNRYLNNVRLNYQALGGSYSYSMDSIIAMLEAQAIDTRPVHWPDILSKPAGFTPASHWHDIGDIYGFEYLVHSIERLRSAVLVGDVTSHDEIFKFIDRAIDDVLALLTALTNAFTAHVNDKNNPHNTTKAHVGLGLVEDFTIATKVEAELGIVNNAYMTPLRTKQAITEQIVIPFTAHVTDMDNPHVTTKTQVGLGLVDNFATASKLEAEIGTSNSLFMTPLRTKEAIDKIAVSSLNTHVNDKSNPHVVTKAQVGLDLVENYSIASKADAEAGVSNSLYMTPLRTKEGIDKFAIAPLNTHINNKSNPHVVTKTQIGLGSVENYPPATLSEAVDGLRNDRYLTPSTTQAAIRAAFAAGTSYTHADRKDNPHEVTAMQIGAVPTSRTINGKPLTGNIVIDIPANILDINGVITVVNSMKLVADIRWSAETTQFATSWPAIPAGVISGVALFGSSTQAPKGTVITTIHDVYLSEGQAPTSSRWFDSVDGIGYRYLQKKIGHDWINVSAL